ncbi:MAG: hypothetical protein ACI97A_000688 [Planctomycetota bacterium]|jgi:hypothetical protein
MKFAIWGFVGAIIGAGIGYGVIGGMEGAGVGNQVTFTIHLAITFAFVGSWCAVIFDKKATAHE